MKKHLTTIAKVIAVLLTIQCLVAVAVYMSLPDWTARGQFGDMFGVVNAFFSACAFAGIIFTIILQREELELQRMELNLTRTELHRSASAQEKSEYALSRQAKAADLSARLAAINHLIQHLNSEIEPLQEQLSRGVNMQHNQRILAGLIPKREMLVKQLFDAYDEITQQTDSTTESLN